MPAKCRLRRHASVVICIYGYRTVRVHYSYLNSWYWYDWYIYNIALSAASLIHAGKMQATQERLD